MRKVTIISFPLQLEDSSSCKKFDFVQLKARVGYITRETTWCGFISPRQRTLKVDGRAIEITFRSDASFNTKGFKISYRGYGKFMALFTRLHNVCTFHFCCPSKAIKFGGRLKEISHAGNFAKKEEQRWHSRLVGGLCERGPKFDPRISHPCFGFFSFCVASVYL